MLSLKASGNLKIYNVTSSARVLSKFEMAGGLICTLEGATSVDVDHYQHNGVVTHMAAGRGPNTVGGLFAFIDYSNDLTININNSINNGVVNATFTSTGPSIIFYIGGFTGRVLGRCSNGIPCNLAMTVSNTRNAGNVFAEKGANCIMGGMFADFGGVYSNVHANVSLTLSNCSNVGVTESITTSSSVIGGLIGEIGYSNSTVSFNDCSVDAVLTGNSTTSSVGGFIGDFQFKTNYSSSVTFSGCNNSGNVMSNGKNVSSNAGGFIGSLKSQAKSDQFSATFLNSMNAGSVKSTGNASGFMVNNELDRSTVRNCVQKGLIDAPDSFSISSYEVSVHNFATTTDNLLWGKSSAGASDVINVFGAGGACGNIESCKVISKEGNKNAFCYVLQADKKVRVDELMNTYITDKEWYFWSSKLDPTDLFVVMVYEENSVVAEVKRNFGAKLDSIDVLQDCFNSDECSVIDVFNGTEYRTESEIHSDLLLSIGEPSSSAKTSSVKSSGANPSALSPSSAHHFSFIEAVNIFCFFFFVTALNMIL